MICDPKTFKSRASQTKRKKQNQYNNAIDGVLSYNTSEAHRNGISVTGTYSSTYIEKNQEVHENGDNEEQLHHRERCGADKEKQNGVPAHA